MKLEVYCWLLKFFFSEVWRWYICRKIFFVKASLAQVELEVFITMVAAPLTYFHTCKTNDMIVSHMRLRALKALLFLEFGFLKHFFDIIGESMNSEYTFCFDRWVKEPKENTVKIGRSCNSVLSLLYTSKWLGETWKFQKKFDLIPVQWNISHKFNREKRKSIANI